MTIEQYLRESLEGTGEDKMNFARHTGRLIGFGFKTAFRALYIYLFILFIITPMAIVSEITQEGVPLYLQYVFEYKLVISICISLAMSVLLWRFRPSLLERVSRKYEEGNLFSNDEYKRAVELLENWKTTTYAKAVEQFGERPVDMLVLATSVYEEKGQLKRIVSLRSIREDREADVRDDREE